MLVQDLRHAARRMLRSPGFTAAAVGVLALGIGACSAVFSLVQAVLIRPLPFREPERLVWIWATRTDRDRAFFSIPDFLDYRASARTLQGMAAFGSWGANLTGGGDPERLQGVRITPDAFRLLGVEAAAGRVLVPGDAGPGGSRSVLLGHGLWRRRFGGDPAAVGGSVTLDGETYTVVGVLPRGFTLPGAEVEIARPLVPESDPRRGERGSNFLRVVARLGSGVTPEQAAADLGAICARLRSDHPGTNAKHTPPRLIPLRDEIAGIYGPALRALLGAVACVLAVACANLAGLLLARSAARRREFAIRKALGATRARLVRQLLAESALLVSLGGGLGLLLAWWGVDLLLLLGPADLPRSGEVRVDGVVLAFAAGISLLSGLAFGTAPAIAASRADLGEALKGGIPGRAAGGGAAGRLGAGRGGAGLLVVVEVALSLVLLVGVGLLARSFARLQGVGAGFDTGGLLLARLSLPPSRYATPEGVADFYDRAADRLARLPGVAAVGAASILPLSRLNARTDFTIAGKAPASPAEAPAAQNRWVSPGYFRALGIPIVAGREFTERDRAGAPWVAVVDRALARRYWGDEDPIGAHLRIDDGANRPRDLEVVGVVGDVKHDGLDEDPTATLYAPLRQVPQGTVGFVAAGLSLVVRGASDPLALAPAVRRELRSVDADVPATGLRTMDQLLAASVAPRRFSLALVAAFAGAAVALAGMGLYALLAYSVACRTREIGIRLALGARGADLIRMVVGQAARPVACGVALGLAAAFGLTRSLSALLYRTDPADPATLLAAPLVMAVVALLASYVPARRAARVDPAIALRAEPFS